MPLVVSWIVTSSGRPSSAPSTCSWVTGRSLPTSGHSCSVRRSSTVGVSRSFASSRKSAMSRVMRLHGRHGSVTGSPGDELVDVVDDDDRVVATVTRAAMRAERLRHRAVFVVVRSTDGRAARPPPQRRQGPVAGPVGHRRRRRRRRRRGLRRRRAARAGRGDRRSATSCRYRSAPVASPTPTSTSLARCYRVVHDGPFRFADGEVVEARWVDAAGLAACCARGAVRARQRRPAAARDSLSLSARSRPPGRGSRPRVGTGRNAR